MRIRAALACLAATSAALTSLAVSAPSGAAASVTTPRITVLANNVMLLPEILGGLSNSTRAGLLANASYLNGYDVLVLSEMFDNGPSNTIKTGLSDRYPHQTPVLGRSTSGWDQTLGDFSWLTPEDGGVTILSKWPILRKVQYVYDEGCGADWFSNKGFVYVVLNVNGQKVHVVGSHAQAEDSLCGDAAAVRATQFAELNAFLDGQDIPPSQQVIIAGDLNVIKTSPEYAEMLALTGTVAPTSYRGAPYSWDPSTNSMAASRYAGYAPEQLDYVLYRRAHARPATRTNTVLTPQSPPWESGGTTFTDYSDHYPVAG